MAEYQGEKLKEFLSKRNVSAADLAEKLGISRQSVYQYYKSSNLTREVVNNILTALNTNTEEVFGVKKKSLIPNTKSIGDIPEYLDEIETPFTDLENGQILMLIPKVNAYSYAGYLTGFADPEYLEELPKVSLVVNKEHRGKYRAFEIVGDSMDDNSKDSIPDKSVVTGRSIPRHHWNVKLHLSRFPDYVIVHRTEGICTKRITSHDIVKGTITCHSLNPDKINYPDFDLKLDEIDEIYNIVAVTGYR